MSEANARILLWGITGSGKTTTLQTIHAKLRSELRGDLQDVPTRLDPTVTYEVLPIQLGEVGGVESQLEIVAVPGAPEQQMTRKQLLDQIEGIVLVLDCAPDRIEENWSAIEELRTSLEDYGHRLEDFPVVLQYNKRDVADPFAIEALHRRIGLDQSAVFETIATTGHGILATLTTISKHVVRARKSRSASGPVSTLEPASAQPPADPNATSHDVLEAAILAEADGASADDDLVMEGVALDLSSEGTQPDWNAVAATEPNKPVAALGGALRIVSVGQASLEEPGGLRLPLVLGDEDGQTRSVVLSLRIDPLLTGNDD